jgi:hypothetical protein
MTWYYRAYRDYARANQSIEENQMNKLIQRVVQMDDSRVINGYRQVVYVTQSGKIIVHFEC